MTRAILGALIAAACTLKDHSVTNSLTAKGYGEELPIASNATADGRQLNRRVALRIVGGP